ncbi:MAG: hypothetical protein ACLTSS_08235 [Phocaeicola coprocola]
MTVFSRSNCRERSPLATAQQASYWDCRRYPQRSLNHYRLNRITRNESHSPLTDAETDHLAAISLLSFWFRS